LELAGRGIGRACDDDVPPQITHFTSHTATASTLGLFRNWFREEREREVYIYIHHYYNRLGKIRTFLRVVLDPVFVLRTFYQRYFGSSIVIHRHTARRLVGLDRIGSDWSIPNFFILERASSLLDG
jgi:hypothetical protein